MIKFRAWSKDLSKYRKLDDISNDQGLGMFFEVQNGIGSNVTSICYSVGDVVEQFTGLKDVNGKDIYEGDIVQPVSSYMHLKRGKPFEVKKGNYVYGKWIAKDISNKVFSVNGCYFDYEIQVTGNVHENPELLKG
ncbi:MULTISPECIES: YopX family protein [Lactiplantibacillus]|nr:MULTISPECIES: YopX family protein [Lactiplantibacillus]MCM8653213.1 YopX family protein [Lactiplantibacillus sp. C232]